MDIHPPFHIHWTHICFINLGITQMHKFEDSMRSQIESTVLSRLLYGLN
jgi:hypothetical protein